MVKNPCAMWGPGFGPWVGKVLWRRAWQPTPVFLPEESPWTEEPVRLQFMGSHRVRYDWVTKHAWVFYVCLFYRWKNWGTVRISNFSKMIKLISSRSMKQIGDILDPRSMLLVLVTQSCPILCDPVDYSPPGSSVFGILQARILEWVAMPFSRGPSQPRDRTQVPTLHMGMCFSRGSSQPRDCTQVSCTAGRFFATWTTMEALCVPKCCAILAPLRWSSCFFCLY